MHPTNCLSAFPVWLDGRNWLPGGTGIHSFTHALNETLTSRNIPTAILLDRDSSKPHSITTNLRKFCNAMIGRLPAIRDTSHGDIIIDDLYRTAHTRFRLRGQISEFDVANAATPPKVVHWTSPLPIQARGALNVVTIHDIIPLTHPNLTGIDSRRFEDLLGRLFERVDGITTVSEAVRSEIVSRFGIAPGRIRNLYQPVSHSALQIEAARAVQPIVQDGGYICVGRVEARKNIDRLLEAHALSHTRRPITLIGPDGDDRPACISRGVTSTVRRVKWCEKTQLLRTILGARALLFPSLAEGFGLPIIEAMGLGIPVMTSGVGATAEIAGDAAILVDPENVQEMAAAIAALDRDDASGIEARHRLVSAGYQRAQLFTKEAFAEKVIGFYRELASACGI